MIYTARADDGAIEREELLDFPFRFDGRTNRDFDRWVIGALLILREFVERTFVGIGGSFFISTRVLLRRRMDSSTKKSIRSS